MLNVHGGGWGHKGFPDLLIFDHGSCIAVEIKRTDSSYDLTPTQKLWIKRLRLRGIQAECARGYQEFLTVLDKFYEHTSRSSSA